MSSRFVRPDTTTLTISQGDTLTVKRRLTAGEQRARFARMSTSVNGDLRVNRLQVGLSTITAYLLDWTLKDDDGKPVMIRDKSIAALESVLDGLDPDSFGEILAAVEAHEEAMSAEREAEKKTEQTTGAVATSTSPSSAAGP